MSLKTTYDYYEQTNAVTTIFGDSEDGAPKESAIPFFFDNWFHGDKRKSRPTLLDEQLGTKTLEEYSRSFPNWRINSVIEIGFNSPDQTTIPSDADWEVSFDKSEQAVITLEGGNNEPTNPFRTTFDYDGTDDVHKSIEKGPYTNVEKIDAFGQDNIDGIRASAIYGGSDWYLDTAKSQGETLASIVAAAGGSPAIPAILFTYFAHITTFYTFIDAIYMADGTKVVRMWDASRYPAHALYVGDIRRDQNQFRENIEWVEQGGVFEHEAFLRFAQEGNTVGLTPFDQGGSFGYRTFWDYGSNPHPVGTYLNSGTKLLASDVRDTFIDPLFPPNIDSPF